MKLKKLIFTKNFTWKKFYNLFLAKVQWKIFKNADFSNYLPAYKKSISIKNHKKT